MKDRAPRPRLVIFDCDGVLVDSEPVSLEVMLALLAELGCTLDPSEGYAHFLGKSLGSVREWLERERGVALNDTVLAEMRRRLLARFEAELQAMPGVDAAVRQLETPVCVASSSQPDRIRLSLRVTGLLPLFEPNLFSATMVANGKPAPDLFLLAARRMGADPADCLVVEDSPAGIAAAHAAGMRSIAFVGGSHAKAAHLRSAVEKLAPMAIISEMTMLPALIRSVA
ncbi:MAG: HAD family hydrolase [Rhodobacteraceae bacterium]|nr:HAD family hydrolase [Paracoccaceae bacterium]